jgi:hypothetical protein
MFLYDRFRGLSSESSESKELNDVLMPIGAKMYEQAAPADEQVADDNEQTDSKKKKDDDPMEDEVIEEK